MQNNCQKLRAEYAELLEKKQDLDALWGKLEMIKDDKDQRSDANQILMEVSKLVEEMGLRIKEEARSIEYNKRYEEFKREFDLQVKNLTYKNFHMLVGMTKDQFSDALRPLKEKMDLVAKKEIEKEHIPFIVVPGESFPPLKSKLQIVEMNGKKVIFKINTDESRTAEGLVEVPRSFAYLMVDVNLGHEALKKREGKDVLANFKKEGRSPLTMEEGIALFWQHPEILKEGGNEGMNLLGTRIGRFYYAALVRELQGAPMLDECLWFRDNGWDTPSCRERIGM